MNKVYAKNNYRIKIDYSEKIQSITLRNKLRNKGKYWLNQGNFLLQIKVMRYFDEWHNDDGDIYPF